MGRQTWLADEFRKAGLKVVEVAGWKTRGSTSFSPVGVTWHATAGSRNSTAQGEVNVILNGSATAPPPIAQLMIYRDGTIYICAAGRCNHNKVGWAGPNKGLGNTALFGIEMANDNKGEPWSTAQLNAARKATAIMMRKIGADPLKRLAAHYEHQPYAGRPSGETSTKSDPFGVKMTDERPRVKALMSGGGTTTEEEDMEKVYNLLHDGRRDGPSQTKDGGVPIAWIVREFWLVKGEQARQAIRDEAILAAVKGDDDQAAILARIDAKAEEVKAELKAEIEQVPADTAAALGDTPVADMAEILRGVYDAEELAALKAAL